MINTISLDAHWRCNPLNSDTASFNVPFLSAFALDRKAARLEKRFDLPMTDECVGYWLEIGAAPSGTVLLINGRDFGAVQTPLRLDVTDVVALEDNTITLRVVSDTVGGFGAVRLAAVPCDS